MPVICNLPHELWGHIPALKSLPFGEPRLCPACLPVDDPYLTHWTKVAEPWLTKPQLDLPLNCWRDPFVLERPSSSTGERWRVVIGSGIKQPPLVEPSTPGE